MITNNADPGKPLRPNHNKMTCTLGGAGKPALLMPNGWVHQADFFCGSVSAAFLHRSHYGVSFAVFAMLVRYVGECFDA
eukprot:UN3859